MFILLSKILVSLMRNYFPKQPSGVWLHTLSKLYDVPVGFVPSFPISKLCIALFAVAEGWLLLDIGWFVLFFVIHTYSLCHVEPVVRFPARSLTKVLLFLHHCSSVRCWAAVTLFYGLAIFHVFIKWNAHFQTFLLVKICQAGDIT